MNAFENESLESYLIEREIYLVSRYYCKHNDRYLLKDIDRQQLYWGNPDKLTENIYNLIDRNENDEPELIIESIEKHFATLCYYLVNNKSIVEFYSAIGKPINNLNLYAYLFTTSNVYILELSDFECKYVKGLMKDKIYKSKIDHREIHAVIQITFINKNTNNILIHQSREMYGSCDINRHQTMRIVNIINKRLSRQGSEIKLKYVGGKNKFVVSK